MEHVHTSMGTTHRCAGPCGTPGCTCLLSGVLERPRYFPRQLITPDDLTLEADYFRDRARRHNRYLHGWGVVCGALVCPVPGVPWVVSVQPGYVLGPYGDEIDIDRATEVDVRGSGVSGCGDDGTDLTSDPWCREVFVDRQANPVYIAVRYRECLVRPVRAQPAGCGCDDVQCEYSRFRDGYEIGILDRCPDSHRPPMKTMIGDGSPNPACPECMDSPWVVLAEATVDDDGTITRIDNCACRRIVPSTRDAWHTCGDTGWQAGADGGAEAAADAPPPVADAPTPTAAKPAKAAAPRARARKAAGNG